MNKNNASIQLPNNQIEVLEKLSNLVSKEITPKILSQRLRRLKSEVIKLLIKSDDELIDKDWLYDGFYWLDELSEILDPCLKQ